MKESSIDNEEEVNKEGENIGLGDKELGDNTMVGKEKEVGSSYLGDKRRVILIVMMTNITKLSH